MKDGKLYKKISEALEIGLESKGNYHEYSSASVLVPLIWQDGQTALLFEVRSFKLSWQPGEICFPGGRIETIDASPVAAAVRETAEELGLIPGQIKVLGSLDEVISPIGVRLYPFVGYISGSKHIKPSQDEVSEVFAVPLEFLLKTEPIIGHMEMGTRPLDDFPLDLLPGYSPDWKRRKTYKVLFYKYEQYIIWGLTAQVLHNFLAVCRGIKELNHIK